MSQPMLSSEVRDYYANSFDEGARLSAAAEGRLEMLRTQELLRRFLPPAPARVLDVGGATGVHAQWLVKDGYDVDLIDPVARHVERAKGICNAMLADARALPGRDGAYDAVQLLGPLYHLPDRSDRSQALSEAARVVRPGGVVAAAAISRYASLFEHTALAHLHGERMQAAVGKILASAVHDGRGGFTVAYFHRAEELAAELRAAGLVDVEVFGIEGPAWSLLRTELHSHMTPSDDLFQSVLAAARLAEPYPELLAASSHLLAVGHSPVPGPGAPAVQAGAAH